VDFLLEAQRQWATAFAQESQAIANYNLSLVLFQFAKGTLLPHNGIQITEGDLPQCVQVRAVENERQRAHAIAAREHAAVVPVWGESALPAIPAASAPSLPALMMDQKERVPENLESSLPLPMPTGPVAASPPFGPAVPPTSPFTSTLTGQSVTPVTGAVGPALPASGKVGSELPPSPPSPFPLSLPTTPGAIPTPPNGATMPSAPPSPPRLSFGQDPATPGGR
jgi:hypothetical protein